MCDPVEILVLRNRKVDENRVYDFGEVVMADIEFSRTHSFGRERAKEIIEKYTTKYEGELQKFKISHHWVDDVVHLDGVAKGTITLHDDRIDVSVKLGFAARMFKGLIEGKMKDNLDKIIEKYAALDAAG
jgi:putative polyhydroxyalkanoate system protein